ncbi:hypothetical protein Tco_1088977 [Tanacetum coccineum]
MIVKPGDPNHTPPVAETTHEHTNDELTEKEEKQVESDDQAIQTILIGLPEHIYAAVDSCNTAQENLVTCSADDERFRHWGLGEKGKVV